MVGLVLANARLIGRSFAAYADELASLMTERFQLFTTQ
jgi:hypothetical protein